MRMATHQHRHVAGSKFGVLLQQTHHLRGKPRGHGAHMQGRGPKRFVVHIRGHWQVPHGQRWQRLPFGVGQRFLVGGALHGRARHALIAMGEGRWVAGKQAVDGLNQARCGATVGVKRVASVGVLQEGVLAGAQVGAQVGASKSVNRLLGVADHDQRMAVLRWVGAVHTVQALVLPSVGVLELIDQSHRVLGANGGRQRPFILVQSLVQALQQIIEIEHRLLGFPGLVSAAHRQGRVHLQGLLASRGWLGQPFAHAHKERVLVGLGPTFVLQGFGAEAGDQCGVDGVPLLGPGLQLGQVPLKPVLTHPLQANLFGFSGGKQTIDKGRLPSRTRLVLQCQVLGLPSGVCTEHRIGVGQGLCKGL